MNENEKIEIVFYKDNKGFKVPLQTKSEAIEKMAKAMCCLEGNCCRCPYQNNENMCKEFLIIPTDCDYSYYELAEAALKALLEDE